MSILTQTGYASKAAALSASTNTNLNGAALYIGVAGHVEVTPVGQTGTATFLSVPAGTVLPVAVTSVEDNDSVSGYTDLANIVSLSK
jgi:hypothetical protein